MPFLNYFISISSNFIFNLGYRSPEIINSALSKLRLKKIFRMNTDLQAGTMCLNKKEKYVEANHAKPEGACDRHGKNRSSSHHPEH